MTIQHTKTTHPTEKSPDQIMIGEHIGFARTRRITGYLVGTVDRFNNAKQSEEKDRVKHEYSSITP